MLCSMQPSPKSSAGYARAHPVLGGRQRERRQMRVMDGIRGTEEVIRIDEKRQLSRRVNGFGDDAFGMVSGEGARESRAPHQTLGPRPTLADTTLKVSAMRPMPREKDARPQFSIENRYGAESSSQQLLGTSSLSDQWRDADMRFLGSWCEDYQLFDDDSVSECLHLEGNTLSGELSTMMPQGFRLPTPDLSPMPTGYEFCPCCENGDEQETINAAWYRGKRAKMDAQGE